MKTVLTISDSIENTEFDCNICSRTIKAYGMDPLAVVPSFSRSDGTTDLTQDAEEIISFVFEDNSFDSIYLGYITEPSFITNLAARVANLNKKLVISPSFISDMGDILVSEECYYSTRDYLLNKSSLLIINKLEAELICGFSCFNDRDLIRSCKKIFNTYGCLTLIKPCDLSNGKAVLFLGGKTEFITVDKEVNNEIGLGISVACSLTEERDVLEGVNEAYSFVQGLITNEELLTVKLYGLPKSSDIHNDSDSEIKAAETEDISSDEAIISDEDFSSETKTEDYKKEEIKVTESKSVDTLDTEPKNEEAIVEEPVVEAKPAPRKPKYSFDFGFMSSLKVVPKPSTKSSENNETAAPQVSKSNEEEKSENHDQTQAPVMEKPVDKDDVPSDSTKVNEETPKTAENSSLISPTKTIRDIARKFEVELNLKNYSNEETAKTSAIEKGPKSEVINITSPTLRASSSIEELKSLKEKLEGLSDIANSGK